ncbi:hypothetical protein JXA12_02370 [Candidatus Woesearchaeota archaeon]|nr:hypothetical protein [Candidatus Woesearchaeota archaeon]
MPLDYLQQDTDAWVRLHRTGYFPPLEILARLTEETGELANELRENKDCAGQELSDILFTMACMANAHEMDLDEEWWRLMREKYAANGYNRKIAFPRTLEDIRQDVHGASRGYAEPYEALAMMAEAQGELGREVNHLYGHKRKKDDEQRNSLGRAVANVLFSTVYLANAMGIDLHKEWERMKEEKLYRRDRDRYARADD